MEVINPSEREADAQRAEELLAEDASLVTKINKNEAPRHEIDRLRDSNEKERIVLARKYKTAYIGPELVAVIRQERIPSYAE